MGSAHQSAPPVVSARASHHSVSVRERVKRLSLSMTAILIGAALLSPPCLRAADLGDVHGVVHDARHRPIPAAAVELKAATSAWSRSTQSGADGEFAFTGVPLGDYVLTISQSGFVVDGAAYDRGGRAPPRPRTCSSARASPWRRSP